MERLDLHGKRHESVETEVINFIFKHPPPFEIVTGNSKRMRELVEQIINKHGLRCHPKGWTNQGCFVVTSL